ncbi:MAG: glycosyltransferase family 2 protein [Euryarchaeota archaeon]|nr:glycosyltransferase family 2 protein [Euryarchaeota archaeon]
MRSEGARFSLVIPAYNEEERIGEVLRAYLAAADEVIVVANGCTDATVEIVEEFSKRCRNLSLLVFRERLGKGGAVVEGLRRASGEVVGFVDSDLSVPPEELRRLVGVLVEEGWDCVIGSRRAPGAVVQIRQPLLRRLSSRGFNALVRLLFGLKFRDTQCGAKVFKREALEDVLPSITSRGYEFDVELLWKLSRRGCRIREVGIRWRHSGKSKFRLLYGPEMVLSLLRIRLLGG